MKLWLAPLSASTNTLLPSTHPCNFIVFGCVRPLLKNRIAPYAFALFRLPSLSPPLHLLPVWLFAYSSKGIYAYCPPQWNHLPSSLLLYTQDTVNFLPLCLSSLPGSYCQSWKSWLPLFPPSSSYLDPSMDSAYFVPPWKDQTLQLSLYPPERIRFSNCPCRPLVPVTPWYLPHKWLLLLVDPMLVLGFLLASSTSRTTSIAVSKSLGLCGLIWLRMLFCSPTKKIPH